GTQRFHSGTDIGAPMGTPVLAAYPGEVAVADSLGGYGLTVIIRHLEGSQESRYAHLSQMFVQPGDWVEQGQLIGLVGSTGNSTGPHLHFEWRHLTSTGWVAVDAGLHLEMAMENLMQGLQTAQAQSRSGS
ncbi:MAG: M23 family metallopeptidase, partial [Chroococcales cyanobacterium]